MEDNKKIFKTHIACSLEKRSEIDKTDHLKKYIMWENKSNICWLDASMALIAHNKIMKRASQVCPQSKISCIIANYADAISIINNSDESSTQWFELLNLAKSKLSCIQDTTLQYLSPILKYKPGDPDSAFCSLYNLLKQDPIIKGIFDVSWISVKTCSSCNYHSENTKTKPLITLSKIDSFDPKSPTVIYNCKCGKIEQTIKFIFVTLPPCLIFHFENGAGHEKPPLSFVTQERKYYLTGIMTLEKGQESNVNHFITWVRDPLVDMWLDCNDLNPDIVYFTPNFPDIKFEDVSFYVYESFDNLGTIRDYKVISIKNTEEDIPCIDISEESGSENSNSVNNSSEVNKNVKEKEVPLTESQVSTFSADKDSSESHKETIDNDKEHISEVNVQSYSVESSNTPCIVKLDVKKDKNESKSTTETSPDQGIIIQNEEKIIDSEFQNLKISYVKSAKEVSEIVKQNNSDDDKHIEECKLDDQIDTCFNQKQLDQEDVVSPYEEKKFEDNVAIENKNGIEDENEERNQSLLPAKELHVSDLKERNPGDIKAESGITTYIKLSFPKKKYPGLTLFKKKYLKNENKPASDASEIIYPKSVEETKTLKRNREEEEDDTKPRKRFKKNQMLEEMQSIVKEDRTHSMHKASPKLSHHQKISKLKNNIKKKKYWQKHKISHLTLKNYKSSDENKLTHSSMSSAIENSNENDNEGKIKKKIENVCSSHATGCKCEIANLEGTINTVVDYTFAYLCKLSHELKKANSHEK